METSIVILRGPLGRAEPSMRRPYEICNFTITLVTNSRFTELYILYKCTVVISEDIIKSYFYVKALPK